MVDSFAFHIDWTTVAMVIGLFRHTYRRLFVRTTEPRLSYLPPAASRQPSRWKNSPPVWRRAIQNSGISHMGPLTDPP